MSGHHYNLKRNSKSENRNTSTTASNSTSISDEEAQRALIASAMAAEEESSSRQKRSVYGQQQQRPKPNESNSYSNKRPRPNRWGGPGEGNKDRTNRFASRENSNHNHPQHQHRDRHRTNNPVAIVETEESNDANNSNDEKDTNNEPKYKPNFGLSGALAKDEGNGGNVYKGVVLKFQEPPEALAPTTQWRLYVFKKKAAANKNRAAKEDDELLEVLHIAKQSAYLIGRNTDIADIPVLHPSLSSQHAVLQYRGIVVPNNNNNNNSNANSASIRRTCIPYIMDLESTNGTFLNGTKLDPARYYQLRKGDVVTFGASTREYVLMTANTTQV